MTYKKHSSPTPNPLPNTVTAVVLAGGDENEPLAKHFDVASKALIPINGKLLVSYVLEALKASKSVKEIIYVGKKGNQLNEFFDFSLDSGKQFTDSLTKGIEVALNTAPKQDILVVSADLLWLSAEDVDTFISKCTGASIYYPVIPRDVVEKTFPEQKRTYAKLKEGEFTGGSLMLIKTSAVAKLLPFAEKTYKARKNLLALAKLIGFDIIIRFLTRTLTIARLEKHIGKRLGEPVKAVWVARAGIAMDVDELTHLN